VMGDTDGGYGASMTTIALGIPHTPWIPERVESMARLRASLDIPPGPDHYLEFTDRAPNRAWSEQLWRWALGTGADYLLQLQDDVLVPAKFWQHLHAMIEAVPGQVIGLESAHPRGRMLARSGMRWYTTADFLVGVGYVLPRAALEAFLDWRETHLREGWEIHEDTLLGLFCLTTGRRIWHPIPTIIDHDVGIASTYGNDAHAHRRPSVTWSDSTVLGHGAAAMDEPGYWAPRAVPHLGRFYSHTPAMARRWVLGFGEREYRRAMGDTWRGEVLRG
jgi:hypothetical protein